MTVQAAATSFIVAVAMSLGLDAVMELIISAQINLLIPMLDVIFPETFMALFTDMQAIINFEIYNVGNNISEWISLQDSEPSPALTKTLNLLGMESNNFIENDGNTLFFFLIYMVGVIYVGIVEVFFSSRAFFRKSA